MLESLPGADLPAIQERIKTARAEEARMRDEPEWRRHETTQGKGRSTTSTNAITRFMLITATNTRPARWRFRSCSPRFPS